MVIPARVSAASSLRGDLTVTALPPPAFDAAAWGTVLGDYDAGNPASLTQADAPGRVSAFAPTAGTFPPVTRGTPAGQPFTGTRTIGGRNALEYKTTHGLEVALGGLAPASPFTIAAVLQDDNPAYSNWPQPWGDTASIYADAGRWNLYLSQNIPGPTVDTAPHVFVAIYNGAASALWMDGAVACSGALSAAAQLYVTLGAGVSVAYGFPGIMAQTIYYAGAVADPAGLSGALAARYSLALRREPWPPVPATDEIRAHP